MAVEIPTVEELIFDELGKAFALSQFSLHFQPLFDVNDGDLPKLVFTLTEANSENFEQQPHAVSRRDLKLNIDVYDELDTYQGSTGEFDQTLSLGVLHPLRRRIFKLVNAVETLVLQTFDNTRVNGVDFNRPTSSYRRYAMETNDNERGILIATIDLTLSAQYVANYDVKVDDLNNIIGDVSVNNCAGESVPSRVEVVF